MFLKTDKIDNLFLSHMKLSILLEHPDLIEMLADCPAKLHCLDNLSKRRLQTLGT